MRVLVLLFISVNVVAGQTEVSVNFIDNDLKKAIEIAEEENKIIFIDAYTTWCGPCKMMDRDVFSNTEVGNFFNRNFVNLKLDMEKGEGIATAKKYNVRGYPSFLFLNPAGVLLHRGIGFQPADQFLKLAKQALDPSRHLPKLEQQYNQGKRDPELLLNYSKALMQSDPQKSRQIGAEYLETQDTWTTPENMELIASMVEEYQDPYYNFIVEKRHLFIKEFGEGPVDGLILRFLQNHLYSNIEKVDLKNAQGLFTSTFPRSKSAVLYDEFEMNYYQKAGKSNVYIQKAKQYVKKYPNLSWSALNGLAWNFYEQIEDKKGLKWATKWAKKSIVKNSNHYNNDTLAALYYKQGKKKQALKYAHRAIDLAKDVGEDFSATSDLLEKINIMP